MDVMLADVALPLLNESSTFIPVDHTLLGVSTEQEEEAPTIGAIQTACGCRSGASTEPVGSLDSLTTRRSLDDFDPEMMIQDLWVPRESSEPFRTYDRAHDGRWIGMSWQGILVNDAFSTHADQVGDVEPADSLDFGGKIIRPLADDVDGDGYEDPPIVVTGDDGPDPNNFEPDREGGGGGGGGGGSTGGGGAVGPEEPPPCNCDGLTAAQKAENDIDAEAAKILNEILGQANQNMEYASIIWRDSSGVLHHTPLIPTADETGDFDLSALPQNADGSPDYSGVVGFIHSHPAWVTFAGIGPVYMYNRNDPGYLLYPSQTHTAPDGVTVRGDWIVWDSLVNQILFDGGNVANFRQYIAGFDGTKLVLKEYNASDYETNNPATGEDIDPNLQACTC
jgi:hypothetical protein